MRNFKSSAGEFQVQSRLDTIALAQSTYVLAQSLIKQIQFRILQLSSGP